MTPRTSVFFIHVTITQRQDGNTDWLAELTQRKQISPFCPLSLVPLALFFSSWGPRIGSTDKRRRWSLKVWQPWGVSFSVHSSALEPEALGHYEKKGGWGDGVDGVDGG
jgi:hypothetical protein